MYLAPKSIFGQGKGGFESAPGGVHGPDARDSKHLELFRRGLHTAHIAKQDRLEDC